VFGALWAWSEPTLSSDLCERSGIISLLHFSPSGGDIVSGAYALPMASDERKAHQDVANWSLSSMGIGALNGA